MESSKREESVAVAIDKDKGSQYALKWTVENLLSKGQALTLLHVKQKPASVPPSSGISDANEEATRKTRHNPTKELFLPFRCFCARKDIKCNEVILEETDVARAIMEYVSAYAVETLVLGASSRNGLIRRFKAIDVVSTVSKGAPDFCTVYVIAKGKISSVRSATRQPPPKPTPRRQLQRQTSNVRELNAFSTNLGLRASQRTQFTPRKMQEENEIRSPFNRERGYTSKYKPSLLDSDLSFVSSGRPSTDGMFPSFYDNLEPGMTPRLSTSSEYDNRSYASSYSVNELSIDFGFSQGDFSSSSQESGRSSLSGQNMDEVEAEMRRLRLELKQTMDLYNNACKEAISAKQKARELHRWNLEKQQRLEDARLGEEAALALAEKEKAKSRAALEAAQAAKRIAELETQKRMNAEKKVLMETKEEKNAVNTLSHDLRYRRYTINEIEEATEYFSASLKIGEGGYGPVYKGTLDHTPVAIKVLRPDAAQGRSQFQQEVEVLCCIRHPNMVLLLGACPQYGCLVYEYMANGSLDDCLFRRGNTPVLSWQLRFQIAAEIGTGLLFLHQAKPEPLVHRDLKPGNILLDRNYVSKISDVGLARLVPPSVADTVTQYHMTSAAGTFCYIDPEYQQTGMLGIKSDIYSLGIMLLQIITAQPPMGLTHRVERAIEKGTFVDILDPAVSDWPVEEALTFAKLALQCAELRRKDRPDLGKVVLPELNRLRTLAEESMPISTFGGSARPTPIHSQVSTSSIQYVMTQSGYDSSRSGSSTSSFGGRRSRS